MSDTPTPRTAVDAGVFVAALVLFFASIAQGWTVLGWLSGVVLIGVMVTTAARRQFGGGKRPGDSPRPWRRGPE